MRALVFSDTHRNWKAAAAVIKNIGAVDCVFHCGDILSDCRSLEKEFPDLPFYYVCGNNDIGNGVPRVLEAELEGKRVFITHGHLFGVRSGESRLKEKIDEGFDLVLYGHTHIPSTTYYKNGIILNPGSLSLFTGTYGVIEVEGGKLRTAIISV